MKGVLGHGWASRGVIKTPPVFDGDLQSAVAYLSLV